MGENASCAPEMPHEYLPNARPQGGCILCLRPKDHEIHGEAVHGAHRRSAAKPGAARTGDDGTAANSSPSDDKGVSR